MAFKLILPPGSRLPFIWNVSARVGPTTDCPNRRTDVELCKFLLKQELQQPFHRLRNDVRLPPLKVNGTFDAVLGFWIFCDQITPGLPSTVDGIVSPARGFLYSQTAAWVIVKWNVRAVEVNKERWSKLDTDTELSSELRDELSKTTA